MFEDGHRQMPEQAAIIPVPEAAMSRGDETGLIGRGLVRATAIVALAGAAAGLAGCTSSEDAPESRFVQPKPIAPATAMVDRMVAADQFNSNLEGYASDFGKATTLMVKASGGNPKIQAAMQRAIDAKQAASLIGDIRGDITSDVPFVAGQGPKLATIVNPEVRTHSATSIYVFGANKVIEGFDVDEPETMDKARKDIADNMPAGAEEERDNALACVDVKYAEDLTVGVGNADTAEEQKIRDGLSSIKDPKVRATAAKSVDLEDAADALHQLGYNGITAAEARADLANVADDGIRSKALKAVKAHENGDDYAADDIGYDLDEQSSELDLTVTSSEHSEDVAKAIDFVSGLAEVVFKEGNVVDAEFGLEFAKASGLKLSPAEIPAALKNPEQMIDLTELEGKTTVPNSYKLTAPDGTSEDREKREGMPDSFNQFGEIYMKDGKVTFDLQEGLDPKFVEVLKKGYEQVLPFMQAGFASGELATMRFIVADDFDPAYAPTTREVYFVFGKEKISADRLVSAWKHEILHGISRNVLNDTGVTDAERMRVATACNNMKATVYDDFESSLKYDDTKTLERLRDAALPKHKPIIEAFIKSVNDGTLAKDLKANPSSLKYNDMVLNECLEAGNVATLFYDMQARANVTTDKEDELDYLFKSQAYTDFYKKYDVDIQYGSLFNKINESTYMTDADPGKLDMGHSEDNIDEMYASILDAALTWPDKFRETLKGMEREDQKVVLDMLGACTEQMAKHPSLQPYVIKLRTEYKLSA
jgi:hypothetical protein